MGPGYIGRKIPEPEQCNYFQQNRLQVWMLSLEQRAAAFRLDRPSCFVTGALLGTGFCILLYCQCAIYFPFPDELVGGCGRKARPECVSSSDTIVVNYIRFWSNMLPRKNRAVRSDFSDQELLQNTDESAGFCA